VKSDSGPDYADYDACSTRSAPTARGCGHQLGDPAKAAKATLRILDVPDLPAYLLLGSDALRLVTAGRPAVTADFRRWEQLSHSIDLTDPSETGARL
jgi:hypothetical protein